MEKFVRKLSTLITLILLYVVASYSYLSAKGFAFQNGSILFIGEARAESNTEPEAFAKRIPAELDFNFNEPVLLGNADAPLTLYEFSSLGCTHCADFHLSVLPRLAAEWIDTGKLKVVFINFPLERKAMRGALLYACLPVYARDNFLNRVFKNQREWGLSSDYEQILIGYATALGLTKTQAVSCLQNRPVAEDIVSRRQDAIALLGIQGTPAFVIDHKGIKEIHYGLPSYDSLTAYLTQRLAE